MVQRTSLQGMSPQRELEQKGLEAPQRPSEEQPVLPAGLSDFPDRELMDLFRDLVVWSGYAGYTVAEYEIQIRKASRDLRRISDGLTLRLKVKTVSETKALVQQDPSYQEAEDFLENLEDVKLLATSIYTHLEKSAQTVSRELTRRASRGNLDSRNDRYNT